MSQPSLDLEARVAALEAARAPRRARRHISRKRLAALLVALTLAAPAVVLASHRFSDVPNTNTFHNQISILADAGITRGCNPPTNTLYCPADSVRRDQMAAFIIRSAGRMDQTTIDFPLVTDGSAFASLSIKTEGRAWISASAATYFVSLNTADSPSYPCERSIQIAIDGVEDIAGRSWGHEETNPAAGPLNYELIDASPAIAMAVDQGTHTVDLIWYEGFGSCEMSIGRGTLTAVVVPFDASTAGNPTLPTLTETPASNSEATGGGR